MRNQSMEQLDVLIGRWALTLSDAWFLEPEGTTVDGSATFEWLADAFVVLRLELGGHPSYELVIGHSDARDSYAAFYHDERGVSRLFQMTFDDSSWTLTREDPDFYQRFIADVSKDEIAGRWEASEDEGQTWRKDFALTFARAAEQP